MSEQSVDLKTFMQTNPEGTLEQIAQQYQATMTEVIAAIPDAIITDGSQFETVWQEVTTWGDITFLVHNLRHKHALGGHIRAENCLHIAFVERNFMRMATASIIFLNKNGEAMCKIFVGRDEKRQLKADQLDKFRSLAQSVKQA